MLRLFLEQSCARPAASVPVLTSQSSSILQELDSTAQGSSALFLQTLSLLGKHATGTADLIAGPAARKVSTFSVLCCKSELTFSRGLGCGLQGCCFFAARGPCAGFVCGSWAVVRGFSVQGQGGGGEGV